MRAFLERIVLLVLVAGLVWLLWSAGHALFILAGGAVVSLAWLAWDSFGDHLRRNR